MVNDFQYTMKTIQNYDDGSGSGVGISGDGNCSNLLAFFILTTFT